MAASDEFGSFEERRPFASSAVWACVVYSLVPFVGVVFVPFIFVFGVVGLARGERTFRAMGAARGERTFRAMGAGVAILIIQLVLWWLMYVVPKWNVVV